MKLYLAASYERRAEIQEYARRIESEGLAEVQSEWLRSASDDETTASIGAKQKWAEEAFRDIHASDALVLFTPCTARGGASVELGFALALNRPVFLVGPRTSIFTCVAAVSRCYDFEDFLIDLRAGTF